jgi:hypothetical protein
MGYQQKSSQTETHDFKLNGQRSSVGYLASAKTLAWQTTHRWMAKVNEQTKQWNNSSK